MVAFRELDDAVTVQVEVAGRGEGEVDVPPSLHVLL